jgi:hypothetical protein
MPVRVRALTAVAASVLAVTGLSACRSNIGTAAVVAGHRISETDVRKYLAPAGPPAAAVAQAAQSGVTITPKSLALTILVQARVFEMTLAATSGGVPSAAALRAAHTAAAQALTGQSMTGTQFDTLVGSTLADEGLQPSILTTYLHALDLEYALIVRTSATQVSDLGNAVTKQHIVVSINPAYGTWDITKVTVSATQTLDQLPPFMQKLQGYSSAPTAAPTG